MEVPNRGLASAAGEERGRQLTYLVTCRRRARCQRQDGISSLQGLCEVDARTPVLQMKKLRLRDLPKLL